jgi:hypothetical protein
MMSDPISPPDEDHHVRSAATQPDAPGARRVKSIPARVFDFLSGFGLATTLLVLLLLLTWLGTLEQVDNGLFLTAKKYFEPSAFIVVPEYNGKPLPLVLPGVYWVSALLFVNLLLGGVVRMRKGWRVFGVLSARARPATSPSTTSITSSKLPRCATANSSSRSTSSANNSSPTSTRTTVACCAWPTFRSTSR